MSDAAVKAPAMRRSVRILLISSLAVNLLVAGLFVGAMVSNRFDDRGRPSRASQVGGPLTAALSHEDRREIGRSVRKTLRAERPSRDSVEAEFAGFIAALTAEPYDAEAVREAIDRQMQMVVRRTNLGIEALLAQLNEMSVEERAAYSERLKEVLKREPKKKRKSKDKDGD
ncbi:periplasmic heavy metal sensor [Rhodobacteraceae bacterium D3-12]|nr:periplasmic heavy metal sensor [Rhodobacteraceae bacterium D3-12]